MWYINHMQWQILIQKLGLVEQYDAPLYTLLLDLTSGSGFVTGNISSSNLFFANTIKIEKFSHWLMKITTSFLDSFWKSLSIHKYIEECCCPQIVWPFIESLFLVCGYWMTNQWPVCENAVRDLRVLQQWKVFFWQ